MADDLDQFVVPVEGLGREDNRAGSGAYGVVFKVTVGERECIAKKLHNILLRAGEYYPVDQRDAIIEKFRKECSILSGLSHSNIVSFVGVHYGQDRNDISLIMERLHTDLAAFVHSQPNISTAQRIHILWDVSKGLKYLHSLTPPLIHRDLTAPNVLLTEDLTAKIGDMGVSRYVDPDTMTHPLTKAPGNLYYMPPEARTEVPVYTVKLDIFSFGSLIIHAFTGSLPKLHDVPYDERAILLSREGKIELTRRQQAIVQMGGSDHCMYSLIVCCLHDNQDHRPTTQEVCEAINKLCQKHPTVSFQKQEILATLGQQLKEQDTWFLVGINWMKRWKKYVGLDANDRTFTSKKYTSPGPLDNSYLLKNGVLRDGLKEDTDYYLLPESAWTKLSFWYNLKSGSKVIPRKVVRCEDHLIVEVYLLQLNLGVYPNLRDFKSRSFSRADTVADLERAMREDFNIPISSQCRVWLRHITSAYQLLKPDQTIQDAGLCDEQSDIMFLETKNDDGIWPQEISSTSQKIEIEPYLGQNMKKGDLWFLVDSHWFRKWRKYVSGDGSEESLHPGPVDNFGLLDENELRDSLMNWFDYILLPECVWDRFCFWYGLILNSNIISRKVIECDARTMVEVYLLEIGLCYSDQSKKVIKKFSRADTVALLKNTVRKEFHITSEECQMWYESSYGKVVFSTSNQTLLEVGLRNGQTVWVANSIFNQKQEIQACLRQQLMKGDIWFLVDIRWMKQWKKYVGYDSWDQASVGMESANPGLLDNSSLFRDGSLRDHLMDELDYYLLPKSAWNKLSSWYGLTSGSKVISRRVVEYGLYIKHCKVEVYLLEFKLCIHPHLNQTKKKDLSRADTVADLERVMREEFEVPSSTECRVWHRYMTHTFEFLSRADQTLQDAGLYNGQTIVLEMRNEDGTWPRTTSTVSVTN